MFAWGKALCESDRMELDTSYVESLLLLLLVVGSKHKTSQSRQHGCEYRQQKSDSLDYDPFAVKDKRLWASERRFDLCFFNLRLVQSLNRIFLFNTFNMHSLMLFSRAVLQFEIALRNLGPAVLSTCRA